MLDMLWSIKKMYNIIVKAIDSLINLKLARIKMQLLGN